MADRIKVLIVDDIPETRDHLSKLLGFEADVEVVGAAADGGPQPATVIAVFSPKGGVGRTTIGVNLAVAAATLGRKVALVDASFQFGDVGVLLNLSPRNKSIADLSGELQSGELES